MCKTTITTARNQIGRFTNFSRRFPHLCLQQYISESFRSTSSKDMSSPFTPFHSSFNERNTRNFDLDINWFGNRLSQGYNINQEHCDATQFTQPTSGYSNNTSHNIDSVVHSQYIAEPRDESHNTIEPANYQVDQHVPTNFQSNRFDKHIFEGMYHGNSHDSNFDPIPLPDDYQEINNELIELDFDHIVGPHDDQVFDFEKSTKRKHSLANHSYIDFSRVEDEKVMHSTFIQGEKLDTIINVGGAVHDIHDVVIHEYFSMV